MSTALSIVPSFHIHLSNIQYFVNNICTLNYTNALEYILQILTNYKRIFYIELDQYNVHVVDYSCQYNTKYNNHYNPEASAYNALRFCKRISIMLAIFYCIKTKKKKNNFKKMYELFPNKEVLKYNHIGLNNITNGICKINTVDKLHVKCLCLSLDMPLMILKKV